MAVTTLERILEHLKYVLVFWAGVLQEPGLDPLLFLVCINDLSRALHTDVKSFANDTLLFSIVDDSNESTSKLVYVTECTNQKWVLILTELNILRKPFSLEQWKTFLYLTSKIVFYALFAGVHYFVQ